MKRLHTVESLAKLCEPDGACLLWTKACTTHKSGYESPLTMHAGRNVYARRLMRELTDGKPIPPGAQVSAKCGKWRCISAECSVITTPAGRAEIAVKTGKYERKRKPVNIVISKNDWFTGLMR